MNSTEEVPRGFVVAGSDGAILLESSEEVLDQMARLVQMLVIETLRLTKGCRFYTDTAPPPRTGDCFEPSP
jgi:hypothetical protein